MPSRIHAPALAVAASLALLACGTPTEPDVVPVEELGGFVVTAPERVGEGAPFKLSVVARGTQGTEPFDYSGEISLSASSGALSAASVRMDGGAATSMLSISGATGPLQVTASAEGRSGSATIASITVTRLDGEADDRAGGVIPEMDLGEDVGSYGDDPNGPPGAQVAYDLLLVQLEPTATVGDVNALVERHGASIVGGLPAVDAAASGFLILELPTADHAALDEIVHDLDEDGAVRRVMKDLLGGPDLAPGSPEDLPAGWTWSSNPGGGNWGLELARVPQMWNLNGSVAKSGRRIPVLVIDSGFDSTHVDLDYSFLVHNRTSGDHGTHVAGIIAARFDNGIGTDGVTPFAHLRGINARHVAGSTSVARRLTATRAAALDAFAPRVVNVSQGLPYYSYGVNPATSPQWQATLSTAAGMLVDLMSQAPGALPMFAVSAGNDSNPATNQGIGLVQAGLNSEFAYAAIELGVDNILVVEALKHEPAAPSGAGRAVFSNVGGHVSAPGVNILSAVRLGYDYKSGTSMAAPHVAGLMAYLFAVDPDLSNAQMREIVLSTAVPVSDAAPRIDAFAALMDIDRIRGGHAVLRRLVDIDDGTMDGNRRTSPGETFLNEDADGDGGPGDGAIDMSDFRRFRDWLLQIEGDIGTSLDGGSNHPKKDVNQDGVMDAPAGENVYPRGDFNGDGRLHRSETAQVGGAIDAAVTDLAVLQRVFSDPHYGAADLLELLDSGDLSVDGSSMLATDGVHDVLLEVRRGGDDVLVATRTLTEAEPFVVVTVPYELYGYALEATARGPGGEAVADDVTEVAPPVGDDLFWLPEARPTLVIELTAPETAATDAGFPVLARAGLRDVEGVVEYRGGITVRFDVDGGSVSPTVATTAVDGYVTAEGTFTGSTGPVVITATASFEDLEEASALAAVVPLAEGGAVTLDSVTIRGLYTVVAHADAYDSEATAAWQSDYCDREPTPPELDPTTSHALSWTCSAAISDGAASASSGATVSLNLTPLWVDDVVKSIDWSGGGTTTASGTYSVEGSHVVDGAGSAWGSYRLELVLSVTEATTLHVLGTHAPRRAWLALIDEDAGEIWSHGGFYDEVTTSADEEVPLAPGTYTLALSAHVEADHRIGEYHGERSNGSWDFVFTFAGGSPGLSAVSR